VNPTSPKTAYAKSSAVFVSVDSVVVLEVRQHVGPAKADALSDLEVRHAPGSHPFIERARRDFEDDASSRMFFCARFWLRDDREQFRVTACLLALFSGSERAISGKCRVD
jgi:hypothetical protein